MIRDDRLEDGKWAEPRLVDGLAAGRVEAVHEFLERSHHAVYGMAARLSASPDDRRDWAHETLLGVIEDVRRGRFVFTRPGSFWAWFRTRAYYRLLDLYRAGRTRSRRETVDLEMLSLACSGVDSPEAELERTELRAALEACLEQLPNEDHHQALWHLLVNDLSYAAVAERLETPLNTVRAWIRRGRALLRRCLAERLGLELPP